MKIFNWVHKRLHPKVPNDRLASVDERKIEPAINETDTQALLKHVAEADALGSWSNVMLAVGTLGFDTLKTFYHEQGYLTLEGDIEEDQTEQDGDDNKDKYHVEHEELNPLMYATLDDNFSGIVEPIFDIIAADTMATKPEIFSVTADFPSNQVIYINTLVGSDNQKKGERITLADLFLADSVEIDAKTTAETKTMLDANKELSIKKKHRLSFAKKIIPQVTDDSGPLKNLQRLMRRMLKRKVYPDCDVKNVKSDGQKGSTEAGCSVKHKSETSDSISLLPCQGAGV